MSFNELIHGMPDGGSIEVRHEEHDNWTAICSPHDTGEQLELPIKAKNEEDALSVALIAYNDKARQFMSNRPERTVLREQAEEAVRTLLIWAGDNPNREGLKDTPKRVVNAYEEFFAGYNQSTLDLLKTFEEGSGHTSMVVLTGIPFESHCEHHMVPFVGKAHVAYMPDKRVIGISKLARLVEAKAKRLQIQERMTREIASNLHYVLRPKGVAVVIEATHMCMTSRGVGKPGVVMKTSDMQGVFKEDEKLRNEFFSMID